MTRDTVATLTWAILATSLIVAKKPLPFLIVFYYTLKSGQHEGQRQKKAKNMWLPCWTNNDVYDTLELMQRDDRLMNTTSTDLRKKIIYQVFVRNHTEEGTLKALIADLDRIKDLGTDILYLLPIHPIGGKHRKGTMGSPYAIKDYRKISPDLGTMDDFNALIEEVHQRGMKIMMDIVFNHTSWDSVLLKNHPEWFHRDENGEFSGRVGDWWDIVDLDYGYPALWDEMIDVLTGYARMGVDGFRSDVACLVPLDFWKRARQAVSKINADVIWLAETAETHFCKHIRDMGYRCASDGETFQVFDMTYDYDIFPFLKGYWQGRIPLKSYIDRLNEQDGMYPENYVKIRFLENHDQPRIADVLNRNKEKIIFWTVFMFLQKGSAFLYAGQEYLSDKRPDLFEKDSIKRNGDIRPLIKKLCRLKKKELFANGAFVYEIKDNSIVHLTITGARDIINAFFNFGNESCRVVTDMPDGKYDDLVSNETHRIEDMMIDVGMKPIVIKTGIRG